MDFESIMEPTPTLTVGIPVYNEEYAIVTAIASVLNQTWAGSLEILVVDDGSTDETLAVVENLSSRHKSIRVLRHGKNQGRPAARSTLIQHARGEFFAMLDADDEWYPDKLQRQFEHFTRRSTEIDTSSLMVCGNIHHVDLDNGTERIKDFARGYGELGYDIRRVLRGDNTPISQLALLKTDFLKKVGPFDPELTRAQDWDFLIRFLAMGGSIEFVPDRPLAMFYFKRSGRSRQVVRECMEKVISKHLTLYETYGVDPEMVRVSIENYIQSFNAE